MNEMAYFSIETESTKKKRETDIRDEDTPFSGSTITDCEEESKFPKPKHKLKKTAQEKEEAINMLQDVIKWPNTHTVGTLKD